MPKRNIKGKGRGRKRRAGGASTVPIPRMPPAGRPIPRFERARLVFYQQYVMNNAGNTGASDYVKMNNPQTVSFHFTSDAPGGYAQLAALYQQLRVLKTKIAVKAVNLETFPVTIWTMPIGEINPITGITPALNDVSTPAQFSNLGANPAMRYQVLGSASSKPDGRVSSTFDIFKWSGIKWTGTPDDYSEYGAGAPAVTMYHGWGITNPTTNLANGVMMDFKVTYDVVFFDYLLQKNGLFMTPIPRHLTGLPVTPDGDIVISVPDHHIQTVRRTLVDPDAPQKVFRQDSKGNFVLV